MKHIPNKIVSYCVVEMYANDLKKNDFFTGIVQPIQLTNKKLTNLFSKGMV